MHLSLFLGVGDLWGAAEKLMVQKDGFQTLG